MRNFVSSPSVHATRRLPRVIPALGALVLSLSAGALFYPRSVADAAPEAAHARASAHGARTSLLADLGPHKPTTFVPRGAVVASAAAFVPPTPPARPPELQGVRAAAPVEPARETASASSEAPTPPRRPAEYGVASRASEPQEPPTVTASRAAPQQEPTPAQPLRAALPAQPPRQVARTTVVPAAAPDGRGFFERLFGGAPQAAAPAARGRQAPQQAMAYAATDTGGLFGGLHSAVAPANPASRYDRYTAVYDISARTVYLPNGQRLEAHSGLREYLDNPRYAHLRMRGATPPHVYELTPREALFHGVEALRLNPVGGAGAIHGRAGLLAHTYMLGPNGDSNGCVSFRDYNAFLRAYKNGEVRRLAVVAHL